jgi:hypothetical protein
VLVRSTKMPSSFFSSSILSGSTARNSGPFRARVPARVPLRCDGGPAGWVGLRLDQLQRRRRRLVAEEVLANAGPVRGGRPRLYRAVADAGAAGLAFERRIRAKREAEAERAKANGPASPTSISRRTHVGTGSAAPWSTTPRPPALHVTPIGRLRDPVAFTASSRPRRPALHRWRLDGRQQPRNILTSVELCPIGFGTCLDNSP